MTDQLNAEAPTDAIATALRTANDQLETIVTENNGLRTLFENNKWTGLDRIGTAAGNLGNVRDKLATVADKVGIGGAAVRDAHNTNRMVGTKESVVGS